MLACKNANGQKQNVSLLVTTADTDHLFQNFWQIGEMSNNSVLPAGNTLAVDIIFSRTTQVLQNGLF